jgi:hypothetical protein
MNDKNLESMNKTLETLEKNAPKEGYFRAIKKRYFKPKTNWAMLGVLIALAGLIAMWVSNFS